MFKKIVMIFVFGAILNGCMMFEKQNTEEVVVIDQNQKVFSDLALAGGGYLSSDRAIDMLPIVFFHSNHNKKYLFFSSDRNGDRDIYYAEILSDEKFGNPIRLTNQINTTNHENLMDILYHNGKINLLVKNQTNQYKFMELKNDLSVDRIILVTNLPYSNITAYSLQGNLFFYMSDQTTNFTVSILDSNYTLEPVATLSEIRYPIYSIRPFDVSTFPSALQINLNGMVSSSLTTFTLVEWNYFNQSSKGYFLFTTKKSGKYQLGVALSFESEILTNFLMSDYASSFNDSFPHIDLSTMKLYFTSDRFNGTNDLYRYNDILFSRVVSNSFAYFTNFTMNTNHLSNNSPFHL